MTLVRGGLPDMWFEESHAIDLWNSSVLAIPIGFYSRKRLCIAGQGKAPKGTPFSVRKSG
jgi:hypothetical protein